MIDEVCEACGSEQCESGCFETSAEDFIDDIRLESLVIIYLGDFLSDARCINMANSFLQPNNNMDDRLANVSIISTDHVEKVMAAKKKSKLIQNINFFPVKIVKGGIKKYMGFYRQVNNILKDKNFDCVISGDLYSLANCVRYKKKNDCCSKIIYDCREIYSDLYAHRKKPLLKQICKIYESYFMKKVDEIIVTADSDKQILTKKYSLIDNEKWHIIYNYPKYTNLVNNKMNFNLPGNTIKVIYQGVIQKGRGIKQLIELTHYSNNISSVILGSGPEKNQYVQLTKKLNLEEKIIFIDSVDYLDVFKYTQGCDIGWCMIDTKGKSNQNALPNKLFEYVMMGLPVISSNLPNIKKIIDCHHVGKIINNYSLENIEKEIIDLMKNKKNPKQYNNIIKQYFSFELQGFKFVEIIDDGDSGPSIIGGDKIFTDENKFGN